MILMLPTRISTCLSSMIDLKKCRPDGAWLSEIRIVLPKCQPFGLNVGTSVLSGSSLLQIKLSCQRGVTHTHLA